MILGGWTTGSAVATVAAAASVVSSDPAAGATAAVSTASSGRCSAVSPVAAKVVGAEARAASKHKRRSGRIVDIIHLP
jgi:hypothetical protein